MSECAIPCHFTNAELDIEIWNNTHLDIEIRNNAQLWHDVYTVQCTYLDLSTTHIHKYIYNTYLYVTAGMDISAGSVPAGPNLTGEMEPGMNTNI